MHIRRAVVLALIVTPLAALSARQARACVCGPEVPFSQHVAAASAIFEGVVREQGVDANWQPVARFEVSRRWKGEISASQLLRFAGSSDCHAGFAKGERYVIFAQERDGVLFDARTCGTAAPGAPSAALLAALGPEMAPLPNVGRQEVVIDPMAPLTGGCQLASGGPAGWGALGVLLGAGLLARRRRG